MRGPHNLWRLLRTAATFERTGATHLALETLNAPRSIRWTAKLLGVPLKIFGMRGDPKETPILRALIALGPPYIKFGQLMSTRPDIVGVKLADELKVLQDALPPFSQREARKTIERELNIKVDEFFSTFGEPVAAASLAQVHKANVRATNELVAIKVLRPGIEKAFLTDVDAFYLAAKIIEIFSKASRRLKPGAVIEQFEGIARAE